MTKYHIPPPTRCHLPEGWSPGPTKRVIRPDDALLTSLLDFSEEEEVVFWSFVLVEEVFFVSVLFEELFFCPSSIWGCVLVLLLFEEVSS